MIVRNGLLLTSATALTVLYLGIPVGPIGTMGQSQASASFQREVQGSRVDELVLDGGDHAVKALHGMGTAILPRFWELLRGADEETEKLDLRPEHIESILRVVQGWPADPVCDQLKELQIAEDDIPGQVARIELLRVVRSTRAVKMAVAFLEATDPLILHSATFKHLAGGLFREALDGGAERRNALLAELDTASLPLIQVFVRSVDPGLHRSAADFLVRGALQHDALQSDVLKSLAKVEKTIALEDASFMESLVREGIGSNSPRDRRMAVAVAATWGLNGLFFELVGALEDSDATTGSLARKALIKMTGVRTRRTADAWRDWHEEEFEWLANAAALQTALKGDDAYSAVQASRELAEHPFLASEIVELLKVGLEHAHPKVRITAIQSLASSAHSLAVEPIIGALSDQDSNVVAAAHAALQRMTGQAFGPESDAWITWWAAQRG